MASPSIRIATNSQKSSSFSFPGARIKTSCFLTNRSLLMQNIRVLKEWTWLHCLFWNEMKLAMSDTCGFHSCLPGLTYNKYANLLIGKRYKAMYSMNEIIKHDPKISLKYSKHNFIFLFKICFLWEESCLASTWLVIYLPGLLQAQNGTNL